MVSASKGDGESSQTHFELDEWVTNVIDNIVNEWTLYQEECQQEPTGGGEPRCMNDLQDRL